MRKTQYNALLFLFILALTNGCKDPFSFNTNASSGQLTVDGGITNLPGPYRLKLGRTQGTARAPGGVTGATIIATDDQGLQEAYHEVAEGTYELPGTTIHGAPGRTYFIDIVLPSGAHYQSVPDKLPGVLAKDSAWFKLNTVNLVSSEGIPISRPVIDIFFNAKLPTASAYLRWNVDEVYRFYPTCFPNPFNSCPEPCYITQAVSLSKIVLASTKDLAGNQLSNVHLQQREPDNTFLSMHYFNVNQYSLSEAAHTYWKHVQQLTEHTGSIFDTPVANLKGNVFNVNDPKEVVYGYFEAAGSKTIHVGVARGYLPFELPDPCRFKPGFGTAYPSTCLNCLSIENSTHVQPAWFN